MFGVHVPTGLESTPSVHVCESDPPVFDVPVLHAGVQTAPERIGFEQAVEKDIDAVSGGRVQLLPTHDPSGADSTPLVQICERDPFCQKPLLHLPAHVDDDVMFTRGH